jgi:hypothetical protein
VEVQEPEGSEPTPPPVGEEMSKEPEGRSDPVWIDVDIGSETDEETAAGRQMPLGRELEETRESVEVEKMPRRHGEGRDEARSRTAAKAWTAIARGHREV